jgi:O-antigen ligase
MHYLSKQNSAFLLDKLKLYLLWGIGVTIAFSLLNLNSILIVSLSAAWLLEIFVLEGSLTQRWNLLRKDRLFIAYFFYFLVEAAGIFYATDLFAGWKNFESKLGFLALPVVFCSTPSANRVISGKVLTGFSLSITAASIYCLVVVISKYFQVHDTNLFFYHDLVSPVAHHAIYFSVFIFISLIFLFLNNDTPAWLKKNKWLRIIWISYYLVFLILLASKMLLLVLIPFVLYISFQQYGKRGLKKQIIGLTVMLTLALIVLFSFDNPIKRRFTDLLSTDMTFLSQEKYAPGKYFNGIELRLLLWRFTYDILTEKKAWIAGVGPADSQPALKEKYLGMNMYAGHNREGDEGYLVFNCHNQFLQTTLQSGLIGLFILLLWCYTIITKALKKNDLLLNATILVTLIFFFSESVFERQYGMILCTFFPLLLMYSGPIKKKDPLAHS